MPQHEMVPQSERMELTEDDEEPFMICEDLCEIITDTEQAEGVEVIKKSDELEEPRADPEKEGEV